MRKELEKIITNNVTSYLDEIDIDSLIKELSSKKAVEEVLDRMIKDKIAETFRKKMIDKYIENQMVIDSYATDKLRNLLKELGIK